MSISLGEVLLTLLEPDSLRARETAMMMMMENTVGVGLWRVYNEGRWIEEEIKRIGVNHALMMMVLMAVLMGDDEVFCINIHKIYKKIA